MKQDLCNQKVVKNEQNFFLMSDFQKKLNDYNISEEAKFDKSFRANHKNVIGRNKAKKRGILFFVKTYDKIKQSINHNSLLALHFLYDCINT